MALGAIGLNFLLLSKTEEGWHTSTALFERLRVYIVRHFNVVDTEAWIDDSCLILQSDEVALDCVQ